MLIRRQSYNIFLKQPNSQPFNQGNRIKILLTPCEWHRLEGCFDLRKNSSIK